MVSHGRNKLNIKIVFICAIEVAVKFITSDSVKSTFPDFVFMCFLVGNDFLPAIPTLAINDGAMTTMLNIYRTHIAAKGFNLVKNNKPNWPAIEAFLSNLGHMELDTLKARREEELEYQRRQARKDDSGVVPVPPTPITNMTDYKKRYYGEKLGIQQPVMEQHERYLEP